MARAQGQADPARDAAAVVDGVGKGALGSWSNHSTGKSDRLHPSFQRVVVRDRQPEAIEWTPPVRPFLERQRECPQGALGTLPLSEDDGLAWYVA